MQYKYFTSYKGRRVEPAQRVEVYRNLRYKEEKTYSIRDLKSGLVLGHATNLLLSNCWFVVNQAARKRVLRDQRKNICAWIEGNFCIIHAMDDSIFSEGYSVKFNPYIHETFVREYEEGETQHILVAGITYINEYGVYASGF